MRPIISAVAWVLLISVQRMMSGGKKKKLKATKTFIDPVTFIP